MAVKREIAKWDREINMKFISKVVVAALVASSIAGVAAQSRASTFVAWEVSNLPFGDTLNVRKFPSNGSQKSSAYPNGAVLQMTGRCTGGLNLKNIQQLPAKKQQHMVRYRWCQVWHDPMQNGDFVEGWVYGRYIAPLR
ncbi:MAG: SH3 domain-containing protein [Rhizobiaceae bacterium]